MATEAQTCAIGIYAIGTCAIGIIALRPLLSVYEPRVTRHERRIKYAKQTQFAKKSNERK